MNSDTKNIKDKGVPDMEIGAHDMEIESKDLSFLPEVAGQILQVVLSRSNAKGALIICLSGDLGAGKTTFVQTCASLLGIKERLTSPTFVIMKKYKLDTSLVFGASLQTAGEKQNFAHGFKNMIHMDAYRLGGGRDLESLKFMDLVKDPTNIIFIEWPERISDALPSFKSESIGASICYINIDHKNDGVRIFSISR